MNVDYKIASRHSISARLLKVLNLLVDKDQSYGVPCRFIYVNVAFIRHVVDCCSLSTALFSLDQERAFDSWVDWSSMSSILLSMGFGPFFVKCVDLFYFNSRSSVNVNSYASESFSLSRGGRKGSPLSLVLYILVVEALACSIRANPYICGLLS